MFLKIFYVPCVVVNNMVRHMYDMIRLISMRTHFPEKGEYGTHMKFRVVPGISTILSYVGQCDLNNNCFGLP